MKKQDLESQLIDDVAGFTHNPLGYVRYAYDWGQGELSNSQGPREWQAQILRDIGQHLKNPETRYQPLMIAVASGHGIGKSSLISMIENWGMSTCEDCKVVVTANTENQLRTKTWPEIGKWLRLAINGHWFKHTATAMFANDPKHEKTWRADAVAWSENNTEAFAGLHNEGKRIILIFDEASAIADKVWEVAEGALTDEGTEIIWLAFGNPTRNTGRFRECFRRFRHRWKTYQIDSRTVEGTNKKQIQKWVDDYGEDSDFVKVRVRGIFPSMSAKQFISEDDVEAAFGRHLRKEQYEFAPVILGVDPAWSGDDDLVIVKRQGLYSEILLTMPKNDNDVQVANIICRLQDEHKAQAVFVDAGYGTGIVSAGKTMGRSWQLVWFGGGATDKGCKNKRAEMWRDMRDWLKQGGAIPKDNVLRDDLTSVETIANLQGLIQLESKESLKERGMPSPNKADALALTFAYPVMQIAPNAGPQMAVRNSSYDPYAV